MNWSYVVYGLRLLADDEVPGLLADKASAPTDVRVWFHQRPDTRIESGAIWYQSPGSNRHGRPNVTMWRTISPEGAFRCRYDDGVEFLIDSAGNRVWCSLSERATIADAAVYLRGPILGLALRLKGALCLHASAVALGDDAIAILGAAGTGKSTTAAGLVKLGCTLLSDDVTALQSNGGGFRVRPGYPRINLWADASEWLYGPATDLPRVIPAAGVNDWWDKRYRALERERQFEQRDVRLAAVYVLGERCAGEQAPRVEALSPREAFTALTTDTTANYAMDARMRATEFRCLGDLVRTVPVRRVIPHRDPARLPELCDAILATCLEGRRQATRPHHPHFVIRSGSVSLGR